jgi:hypothetical protein
MRGLPIEDPPKRPHRLRSGFICLLLLSLASILVQIITHQLPSCTLRNRGAARDFLRLPVTCPVQVAPLAPALKFTPRATSVYQARLQGAVRLRTETFDSAPADGSGEPFRLGSHLASNSGS